ncbi:DUF3306 domain-containing protein [Bradyrhizobium sp. CCGUVB1N3]|uniref:DUF3306 domain-containing protein n=1 Tax=Bradyrhizobium sp. CCGUVB1N3 TaxID=2949629 RepID=UPI0020B40838|nr:DUF3306 domain-containing protein [Bradyrhizobium sp. CCGUVB1N3]MCP3469833.1 DUF3306 domain-containing protein [Bradyrhizobium sp. CCGUVB1N3]
MGEDKFLVRWSRRKQEAKANATPPAAAMHDDVQSAPKPPVKDNEAEVDLSSLPAIDSITSVTDIKAFLRKGIPQELTRAALRRAWSADPAIRDFVGLAENAWDFNDPSAMPGFGPLDYSEGELAALVDRILGGLRESAEAQLETSVEATDSSRELRQAETSTVEVIAAESATTEIASVPAATQSAVAESAESEREPIRRRAHGGALPR